MSLIDSLLLEEDGAAVFAAPGAGGNRGGRSPRQPGRERPCSGWPRLRPEASPDGVAHAPAACLVRPDKSDRARVVDAPRFRVTQRDTRALFVTPRVGWPQLQLLLERRTPCH
jgi:hypothetical protein